LRRERHTAHRSPQHFSTVICATLGPFPSNTCHLPTPLLPQIKQDLLARDPRKETLDTILADYGPPVLRNVAAYHPAPQRYIDVELPPHAAGLRRSLQQQHQQGSGVAAALGGGLGATHSSSSILRAQASSLGQQGAGGAPLQQSLRQGQPQQLPAWQETPSEFTSISSGLAAFAGQGPAGSGVPMGSSLRGPPPPLAASSSSLNLGDPTSAWGRAAGLTGGIRDSALVCESTFVYPHGVAPKPGQQQQQPGAPAAAAYTAGAGDGLAGAGSSATWEELREQPAPLQAPGDALDWAVRGAGGAAPGALGGPLGG
jgi:hypothetical protein